MSETPNQANANIHQTQVNLDGLLTVLGKNLYSSPSIALRELIQNSHDACERRRLEDPQDFEAEIRIVCNGTDQLVIKDNGSGLTENEIIEYLATIGTGYTRLLREKSADQHLIGCFGLGFLSTYVVADKVDVHTCSYQQPSVALNFSSAGGKSFAVRPASSRPVGSTVTLRLKAEFSSLAKAEVIRSLVSRYCCLLPIAIYLDNDATPLNQLRPPWLAEPNTSPLQLRKTRMAFADLFDTHFSALACIPVHNPAIGLQGLLWIQDGASYATSDNRKVSVFIRSMFITDKEADLLPRWAGFTGAVLECPNFLPTASRESLQEDDTYLQALASVEAALLEGLKDIARNQPEVWQHILSRHGQALLGAAAADSDLLLACKKTLKVPTTMGDFTLPALLKRNPAGLVVKSETGTSTEEVLLRAQGIPVIKGYLFAVTAFCSHYAQLENIPLTTVGNQQTGSRFFPEADDLDSEARQRLTTLFERADTDIAFSRYQPDTVPLVFRIREDVMLKRRIESDESAQRISRAALSLARLHTAEIKAENARVLHLNMNNTIVRKLAGQERADARQAAKMLMAMMLGMVGDLDDQNTLLDALADFNYALNAFMES